MSSFLEGFLFRKVKKTLISICQFKVVFNWSRTWKRTAESKDCETKMWRGSSRKSRPRPERSAIVNNAVNYIKSGLEKGDNTKQCRDFCDVERTRAIEKSWNTREPDSEDYKTSGDNKRNETCFLCLEEKTQREKEVDSLIFRKD